MKKNKKINKTTMENLELKYYMIRGMCSDHLHNDTNNIVMNYIVFKN